MTNANHTRWIWVPLLAAGLLCGPSSSIKGAAAAGAAQNAPAPDPGLDMVRTLQATGPHPSLGTQANVFGRLVGTWDVEYSMFTEDGKVSHSQGEVIVGWVMDGHALQDLFIGYPTKPGGERHMGTTIRYFDPKSAAWRVIFTAPQFNYVRRLTGGPVGDARIVLHGQDPDGTELRWSFNDIRPNTFVWRGEKSHDGGTTWWVEEEHHFRRRITPGDGRRDMIAARESAGPHPSLGDEAKVFGRFAGTWDVDYAEFAEDGRSTRYPGKLIGGWILDGRAFQDLFVADPRGPGEERTMGTTLRYFDNDSGKWHVVYVEPPTDTKVAGSLCTRRDTVAPNCGGPLTTLRTTHSHGAAKCHTTEAKPGESWKSTT